MGIEDEPITDIQIEYPIQRHRIGNRVYLTLADVFPIIARITRSVDDFAYGSGPETATAYGWRKQQVTSGGKLVDSDDNIEGLSESDSPVRWPAFAADDGTVFEVDDYVILIPTVVDDDSDPATSHDLQWLAIPFKTGSGMIRFALTSDLSVMDVSKSGCTVDDYWGIADPGATVTVYNPNASVDHMFSGENGAKGIAAWDNVDSKWWIIQMECNTTGGSLLVDLETEVTNVLSSGNGGTGQSTLTSGQLLMGNGIGPVEMVNRLSGGTF